MKTLSSLLPRDPYVPFVFFLLQVLIPVAFLLHPAETPKAFSADSFSMPLSDRFPGSIPIAAPEHPIVRYCTSRLPLIYFNL